MVSPPDLFVTLLEMAYTFGTLFLYCELGEWVTHQFNLYNHALNDCDWYTFPIKVRRIYLIVLVGVQDPVIIHGYAGTVCTRDAFKKVILVENSEKHQTFFKNKLFYFVCQTVKNGFNYLTMLHRING